VKFIIDEGIPRKARETGAYLVSELDKLKSKFEYIVEVRGRGLLVAMEFSRELSDGIVRGCLERGLLVNPVRPNAVRFMPPLNITMSDVDEAMDLLEPVLADVESQRPVAQ
jgi:acetylornithine/succinyldiaminopimelate/putrescine aminotransferase